MQSYALFQHFRSTKTTVPSKIHPPESDPSQKLPQTHEKQRPTSPLAELLSFAAGQLLPPHFILNLPFRA
jgi:hypothetical protein